MKRKLLIGMTLLILILAGLSTGPAEAIPMAWLQVGNGPEQVLTNWLQSQNSWLLNFSVRTSLYTVSGNVTTDENPCISYGVAFYNISGAALPFSLRVLNPMTPISSRATVYSSFSGSGTDVGGDGFSISSLNPDLDAMGSPGLQTTMLNGLFSAGVDVGEGQAFGPGHPGHSVELESYSSGPMAAPSGGPWNLLGTNLRFDLSGKDIATVNGYSSIAAVPVPEPTSLLLVGLGLVGSALVVRRRQR